MQEFHLILIDKTAEYRKWECRERKRKNKDRDRGRERERICANRNK